MPPKFKFTREEIIDIAIDMVRKSGAQTLSARGLAEQMGSSTKPIFGLFQNMAELRGAVISKAHLKYTEYLHDDMSDGKYPPYKASGMAYIRFAKEERELFKLLFMRDRTEENIKDEREEIRPLLEIIKNNMGISENEAYLFHIEMWIFVHGIATMIATSYIEWDMEFVSSVLSDAFKGMKYRFCEGRKNGSN